MEGSDVVRRRLLAALDLYDEGIELVRARLVRENPGASPAEIRAIFEQWLHHRPEAPFGDVAGRVRVRPPAE